MQAVGQGGVVEMAKIGSTMCIGTVGSNPRGYTLFLRTDLLRGTWNADHNNGILMVSDASDSADGKRLQSKFKPRGRR